MEFSPVNVSVASVDSDIAIVAVAIGYWAASPTSHDQIHRVVAAHVYKTLTRFPRKPHAVVDELSAQDGGTLVSLDAAKELLGYEPVVAKLPSAGYRLASTHVLKMPCCTCPTSLRSLGKWGRDMSRPSVSTVLRKSPVLWLPSIITTPQGSPTSWIRQIWEWGFRS